MTPHRSEPPTHHAPHGGRFVDTSAGKVEIAIFETGVPPCFRLYFFDREGRPRPPNAPATIETLRPDGGRQQFSFVAREDFLQSTSDIPEPHEFHLELRLGQGEQSRTYAMQFTEGAHGHDHLPAPGHGQGEAHGHDHGPATGLLGWLRGLAHSHDLADKIDEGLETNERGIRALKLSLVALGLTAALQLVVVLVSGSVGLLADTIHNFADAATSIPLWIAFALGRRARSRRFTYGYGRTEDLAGILIIGIIFFSAAVAAWESIQKLLHPQPVDHLGWVTAAAVTGFLGNEAVAIFRIRVGTEIGSAALVADGQHARVDGFTSLAVLIGVLGIKFGLPILDPLVGIGITIAILFIVKDAALSIGSRLLDGIEPEILAEIEHAPSHVPGVQRLGAIRARWVGHKVYADVEIQVDPSLSVEQGHRIAEEVAREIRGHIRLIGEVSVRLRPADDRSGARGA